MNEYFAFKDSKSFLRKESLNFCFWGNRGIGDMIFMLPAINSVIHKYKTAKIYVSEGVWGNISASFSEVLPKQVVLIPNPRPEKSEAVQRRIAAINDAEKNYWSEMIMNEALQGKSIDILFSQRNFTFKSVSAERIIRGKTNNGLHEVDLYASLIQQAEIPFRSDFTLRNVVIDGFERKKYVAFIPESGRTEKNLSREKSSQLINRLLNEGYKVDIVGALRRKESKKPQTIKEVINELSKYDLVIGVDTGFLHIADAIGKTCIGIYGPTDPKIYGPYHNLDNCINLSTGNVNDITESTLIEKVKNL